MTETSIAKKHGNFIEKDCVFTGAIPDLIILPISRSKPHPAILSKISLILPG
jgi:hypothetical protein